MEHARHLVRGIDYPHTRSGIVLSSPRPTGGCCPSCILLTRSSAPILTYLGEGDTHFGENTSTSISPSNTFAWRLGWGADYMFTKRFALNTEMAYKRNDGHATVNGNLNNDWNASSFGFLFGAKLFF